MTWMVNPTSVKRNEVRYEILNVAWKGAVGSLVYVIVGTTAQAAIVITSQSHHVATPFYGSWVVE